VIDGRALFPFVGHVVLAWRALARIHSVDHNTLPVIVNVSVCTHARTHLPG
jgi:hypothetical protein